MCQGIMARTVQQIKKVELHQHLDGSIPLRTTWRLMKQHGLNPVPTLREMRRLAGDKYLYAVMADGTMGIPNGSNMMQVVEDIAERPDQVHAGLLANVKGTLEHAKPLVDAGADTQPLKCSCWLGVRLSAELGSGLCVKYEKSPLPSWSKSMQSLTM